MDEISTLAYEGNIDILKIKLREDHSKAIKKDVAMWTPMMIAASAGREQIVRDLVSRGAQVNAVNQTGQCALHYAASKDRYQNGGALDIGDLYENTPLHRAASKGHVKITKLLLQHVACEEERSEVARLLIQHGAYVTIMNKEEQTPLDLAPPNLRRTLKKLSEDIHIVPNDRLLMPFVLFPPQLERTYTEQ
ncbi:PSD10-like protein [Mya arenaria]|uniref:PSD10-like protein n=1 Tax=Mya arenaria TaxID=6604 RepID=A0ABY7DLG2_MYAAR|nr:PSD10-like protein [Mya arenaria]